MKKKQNKKHISQDKFLEKLISSKVGLLSLLVLVILSWNLSRTILNLPTFIIWTKRLLPLLMTILFFVWRGFKMQGFRLKFEFASLVLFLINSVFVTVVFWLASNVLFGSIFLFGYKENIERFNCKILNVYTLNSDKISYVFKGHTYFSQVDLAGLDDKTLKDDYFFQITVNKTFFNSYVLGSAELRGTIENMAYD